MRSLIFMGAGPRRASVIIAGLARFITFEGIDGCGKSTQMGRLAKRWRARGLALVTTREPGGTPLGERIRSLVLPKTVLSSGAPPAPGAELALMCASRAQSVDEIIQPALARGEWVLCDRFHDATEAYQGGGRGFDREAIRALHRWLCRDLQPDFTLIFDLDPAVSLARARRRANAAGAGAEGRFEAEDVAFFTRVAAVYREIAAREPQRCRLIDASGSIARVGERVAAALEPYALA